MSERRDIDWEIALMEHIEELADEHAVAFRDECDRSGGGI